MRNRLRYGATAVALASLALPAFTQRGSPTPDGSSQSASWEDPSNHRVQFVTVEDGVQLEVLDWGGIGRPVVLLAGYNTAHVYDGFAEKLAEWSHVYGITRRGLGASSRPESGYTAQRSADDVLAVLDVLQLTAPVLAGNSFGGQDLSTLGARYPDRMAGHVYLDSAEDPTLAWSDYGFDVSPWQHEALRNDLPEAMRNRPSPDYSSFQAYREWQQRRLGMAVPESELRQIFDTNADSTVGQYLVPGRTRDAIFAGRRKPDYADIRVPVLAFFALRASLANQLDRYKPRNVKQRAAIEHRHATNLGIIRRHIRDLQRGVPAARVVEVPGAVHYVFLSHESQVLREMRAFVAELR